MTSLMRAAEAGHTRIVELLLDAGADVNAQAENGLVALEWAAKSNHQPVMKILFDAGFAQHEQDDDS